MPASDNSAQRQLDGFIDKFTPAIAGQTRDVLAIMRTRLPGAIELVYDNYNALAIGFAASEKTSHAIFSIAVYPRWVSLFFLKNALKLKDPNGRLKGSGNMVRHIVLDGPDSLDEPAVQALMKAALKAADPPFDETQRSCLVIKSISAKQRPRRPKT